MSSSQMWIAYDSNQKKLRIPVLPEKIEVSYPDNNDKQYVYGVGDVTIKKHPGAFVIAFESFFPKNKCQGCIDNPTDPESCVAFLREIMQMDACAKFTYTGGVQTINTYCTINFQTYEQGGDTDTIYYKITITEYKKITVRQITVNTEVKKAKVVTNAGRETTTPAVKTYTVVRGDCLWNIAKKFYGSGAKYTNIYNANKSVIGSNPNLIYPGQVLTIP